MKSTKGMDGVHHEVKTQHQSKEIQDQESSLISRKRESGIRWEQISSNPDRVNLDSCSSGGRPGHVFVLRQRRGARRIAAASSRPRGLLYVLSFFRRGRILEVDFGGVLMKLGFWQGVTAVSANVHGGSAAAAVVFWCLFEMEELVD
ncbi:hypothetical protein ACLB2K_046345 [Fragaria x ananassa]